MSGPQLPATLVLTSNKTQDQHLLSLWLKKTHAVSGSFVSLKRAFMASPSIFLFWFYFVLVNFVFDTCKVMEMLFFPCKPNQTSNCTSGYFSSRKIKPVVAILFDIVINYQGQLVVAIPQENNYGQLNLLFSFLVPLTSAFLSPSVTR